jgi:RimJ/RimL family protein N-acetyltransferase
VGEGKSGSSDRDAPGITEYNTTMLQTARLRLQPWQEHHRKAFAALHADPVVMADLGGPISRAASDAKLERYRAAFDQSGVSRWALEDSAGCFLGYAGVMPRPDPGHPLGPHHEIGWRLAQSAWGRGYATESARAALEHAFRLLRVDEILSYTGSDNDRSQAVMRRLSLRRDPSRDFVATYDSVGQWRGLVWVARRDA